MKKIILSTFVGICLFQSCKKDSSIDLNQSSNLPKKQSFAARLSAQPNLNVSSYGYLVFNTEADFLTFATVIDGATHEEMKTYLASKGFTPRALTLYNSTFNRQLISRDQAIDYALPLSGIISIQGILLRPTNDNKYLLAMKNVYLTSSTYNQLATATLNSSVMNRFTSNQPINTSNENLFTFMNRVPFGYIANYPPNTLTDRRFWGREKSDCGLQSSASCLWEVCTVTRYVFGIRTGSSDEITVGSMNCN